MEEKVELGALSPEQQQQLHHYKIKTRIANEMYLRAHPEVEMLLSDFIRDVFLKRPVNIHEFAADYFSDPDLQMKIGVQVEENAAAKI